MDLLQAVNCARQWYNALSDLNQIIKDEDRDALGFLQRLTPRQQAVSVWIDEHGGLRIDYSDDTHQMIPFERIPDKRIPPMPKAITCMVCGKVALWNDDRISLWAQKTEYDNEAKKCSIIGHICPDCHNLPTQKPGD